MGKICDKLSPFHGNVNIRSIIIFSRNSVEDWSEHPVICSALTFFCEDLDGLACSSKLQKFWK